MLNRPVTTISERNRGTTRFLTGSTPSTCSASSSSRILRAPRSAVIAVPATPATMIAVTNGAYERPVGPAKPEPSPNNADGAHGLSLWYVRRRMRRGLFVVGGLVVAL